MTEYATLSAAMAAKDDLAEVELRYKLLAETFESSPQLRANLNPALERAKADIVRLRAVAQARQGTTKSPGTVVPIDAPRFQKSRFEKSKTTDRTADSSA